MKLATLNRRSTKRVEVGIGQRPIHRAGRRSQPPLPCGTMFDYVNDGRMGLIVCGRELKISFTSVDQIESIYKTVERVGKKHKLKLKLVYCGTTINWPDPEQIDFPALVGIVTHETVEEEFRTLPKSALSPKKIPAGVWSALNATGLAFSETDATYLAVMGWAAASIQVGDGKPLCSVQVDYPSYRRIDGEAKIMGSSEQLTMSVWDY